MSSTVYRMDILQESSFSEIDCFVCAVHDDERSTESVSKILSFGTEIKHAIIIKYDNGSQSDRFESMLKERMQVVTVPNDINGFIRQFKKEIKQYINQRIVIDISCIRTPDIFSIMKILKLMKHTENIPCLYSVPYDYEYFAGEFSYKSSLGDLQNYDLTGFSGNYNATDEDSTYIVFLGFEGSLSLKVLEEAEYRQLIFVNGLPSLYQKYKDISVLNNRSSIKGKRPGSILYAPADNPFEVYNFLETTCAGISSVCISPLGTKPVALGVCLYALDHEDVRIVYPVSDVYSPHITNHVVKTWVFDIELFL